MSTEEFKSRTLSGLIYREFLNDEPIAAFEAAHLQDFVNEAHFYEQVHADMHVPEQTVFNTLDDDVSEDEEIQLQRRNVPKRRRGTH